MSYLKVGKLGRLTSTGAKVIERAYYGQGYIFKDEGAFLDVEHPDRTCYIPELSDNEYTRNDFLKLTKGDQFLAEELFYFCDWQHPESAFDDFKANGEIAYCPVCNKYRYVDSDDFEDNEDWRKATYGDCPECKGKLYDADTCTDKYSKLPL